MCRYGSTMANTARVVQVWDEDTDESGSRALAIVRALQSSGGVPMSGKGGGKAAVHWGAAPLAVHSVGMAVAYPATAAPEIVPPYLALRFYRRTVERPVAKDGRIVGWTAEEVAGRVLPPANLLTGCTLPAEALPFLRDRLQDTLEAVILEMQDTGARRVISELGLSVTLARGRPSAAIRFTVDGIRVTDIYVMDQEPALPGMEAPADYWPKPASIQSSATLTSATFEMLADLLRDSLDRAGHLLPPGAGSPKPGGKEKGAVSIETTPSVTSSDDESTAAKRGHTTRSNPHSCKPIARVSVCPGDASGLGDLTSPLPEGLPTHERERIAA